MKRIIIPAVSLALVVLACALPPADTPSPPDSAVDPGMDTDSDAEVDPGAGADTQADGDVDVDVGLIAHYPLNGNAYDVAEHGLHGQIYNTQATAGALGAPGGGLLFNGVDSIVTIPDDDYLSLQSDFSISFYIKGNSQSDHEWLILTKHMAGVCQPPDTSWMLRYSADFGLRLVNYDTSEECGKTILNAPDVYLLDDLWHHIVLVHDNQQMTMRLYLDAVLVAEVDTTRLNMGNNAVPLVIGNQTNGVPQHALDAALDDLRFYITALDAEAVQALYDLGG